MNPEIYGGVTSPQSIYEVSTEQHHPAGTRGFSQDGRAWRYSVQNTAAALDIGKLAVRQALTAGHLNMAVTTTAVFGVGDKSISVETGATNLVANEYRNGFAYMTDGTGEGQYYKIAANPAHVHATDPTAVIELYDTIATAGASGSTTVSLHRNAYYGPAHSTTLGPPVGVPNVTLPVGSTTAQYGWLQTWGECPVWGETTVGGIALADALIHDTGTAGAVIVGAAVTDRVVGYSLDTGVDTEYQAVFLTIAS